MLITQSRKFQKFKFKLLASISSNTGRQESNQIEFTVAALFLLAPTLLPCSWTVPQSNPAPSALTQAMEEGGEEETAPRDPPLFFPATCTSPTTLPSPAPTHSTPWPRPKPPQHASEAAVPMVARRTRQGPRNGELLAALALDAPAYKRPRRSNEPTHPVPSYLPDNPVSPRSP
jgi:hypothetical protein